MSEWNYKTFEEKLGKKVNYGFILGKSLSGKTTVSKFMAEKLGYTFIDMKAI
jgi:shikimate kinase